MKLSGDRTPPYGVTRRRFLTLSAATLSAGALTTGQGAASQRQGIGPLRWRGFAFGAEVSISLDPGIQKTEAARRDLTDLIARMRQIEAQFTLFDPHGPMQRLNQTGRVAMTADLRRVLDLSAQVHQATDGAFDPTIQTLWQALATGGMPDQGAVGFDRLHWNDHELTLGRGQAVTFNGVAQGYAADEARRLLHARGYSQALINMGEYSALGGGYRLGIADPVEGQLGQIGLHNAALATSSPMAMQIAGQPHILSPKGQGPQWSSVTVHAGSAALADACSTGFCLMSHDAMADAVALLPLKQVYLVDRRGNFGRL